MVTYYTEDITRLPFRVLWRINWRHPIMFMFFALRKLLRWPFPPTFGIARPDRIQTREWEQLPAEVQQQLAPYLKSLEESGMGLCCFSEGPYIGDHKQYTAILKNPSGTIWATATWFWMRIGSIQESKITLSFHSKLADGRQIHTGAMKPSPLSYLVPTDEQLQLLPPGTAPAELIRHHEIALAKAGVDAVTFSREAWLEHALTAGQKGVDNMIEIGLYVPLTDAEVERLKRWRDG